MKKDLREVRKPVMQMIARKAFQTGQPAGVQFQKQRKCQGTAKGQRDRSRKSEGDRRQGADQRVNEATEGPWLLFRMERDGFEQRNDMIRF